MDTSLKFFLGGMLLGIGLVIVFSLAKVNPTPNQPIVREETIEETEQRPTLTADTWEEIFMLGALGWCESRGSTTVSIIDSNGLPSAGLYQFQNATWIMAMKNYGYSPYAENDELLNLIEDPYMQIELASKILKEKNGWNHWRNCSKKLGIDKITF